MVTAHLLLLQVFVETLDKFFENVCELDIIFHVDKVSLFTTDKLCMNSFLQNMFDLLMFADASRCVPSTLCD